MFSAWNQLLSRARRMGADPTIEIQVMTLVYSGSREDDILRQKCGHATCRIRKRSLDDMAGDMKVHMKDDSNGDHGKEGGDGPSRKHRRVEEGGPTTVPTTVPKAGPTGPAASSAGGAGGAVQVDDMVSAWGIQSALPPVHQLPNGGGNRKGRRVAFG